MQEEYGSVEKVWSKKPEVHINPYLADRIKEEIKRQAASAFNISDEIKKAIDPFEKWAKEEIDKRLNDYKEEIIECEIQARMLKLYKKIKG